MSDDALIPEFEPTGKRYAMKRPKARPWTPAEDAALVIVQTACGTEGAALRSAEPFCELLGRRPAYRTDSRPTAAERAKNCFDLLEARRWKMLAGYEGYVPPSLHGIRNICPITYGEAKLFLRPWVELQTKNRTWLSLDELCVLLGRASSGLVDDYTTGVYHSPKFPDPIQPELEPHLVKGFDKLVLGVLESGRVQELFDAVNHRG